MLGVCGRDQGAWPEAFPRGGRLEAGPEKDGDGNAATRAERRQRTVSGGPEHPELVTNRDSDTPYRLSPTKKLAQNT